MGNTLAPRERRRPGSVDAPHSHVSLVLNSPKMKVGEIKEDLSDGGADGTPAADTEWGLGGVGGSCGRLEYDVLQGLFVVELIFSVLEVQMKKPAKVSFMSFHDHDLPLNEMLKLNLCVHVPTD